jgi:EAL domain-containing protein (putative c-di-GMP-specific phosphodiesterase class I)
VLQDACVQTARWRRIFPELPLTVNVKLSPRQVRHAGLVGEVATILSASGLPPAALTLEITESVLAEDQADAAARLWTLKRLGVRLAVDDFGIGHASLAHLRTLLPVDSLKIDKSFVDGITDRSDDAAIVEGVVRLAHLLGLEAVAEGVETAEQAELLRSWDCQGGQGYHFARPAEVDDVGALLRAA